MENRRGGQGQVTTRPALEIQRAHDMLRAVVTGEVPVVWNNSREAIKRLHFCLDTLCWVLKHDHNPVFADNLLKLEAELVGKGYILEERP